MLQVDIDNVNKVAHQCKSRIDHLMKMNEQALNRKVGSYGCFALAVGVSHIADWECMDIHIHHNVRQHAAGSFTVASMIVIVHHCLSSGSPACWSFAKCKVT